MTKLRARFSIPLLLLLLISTILPALTILLTPGRAYAQEKQYHMDRYDSNITVNDDGSLDVQEVLTYVFESGTFKRGLREIDLGKVDSISNVRVEEEKSGQFVPYRKTSFNADDASDSAVTGTYGTENTGDLLRIRWIFGNTSRATRTFRVSYHADHAIRVYDDRDELNWYGVPPEWGAQVNASRVEATFPGNTGKWQTNQIPGSAEVRQYDNKIVWTANNVFSSGFRVGAQIPKGVLANVTKPGWQEQIDQQEKDAEAARQAQAQYDNGIRPLVEIVVLLLGLVIAIGGILWTIMRWYTAGRDKPVKLPIDYLADPPSNLPPGLVGTLLDESADVRDVIATIVDMGKKGNLTISETQNAGFLGIGGSKNFTYTKTGETTEYNYERQLMNALFKKGSQVDLSDLKNTFFSSLPPIYSGMYNELVKLGYFPESPQAVRGRQIGIGVGIIFLGILVGFLWLVFGDQYSRFLIVPAIGLVMVGLVRMGISGAMPRKTDMGSEEAEKWRAFKRYLQSLQQYTQGNVQVAADKFQSYLPYALALGVDREYISQFNNVPASAMSMPTYYIPYGWGPYYGGGGGGSSMSGGTPNMPQGGGGGFDVGGAVQGMSDSFGGAIQGMSDSFSSMVNSASSALTSSPSSSSSGGGGGG
ncbi:MAG: DUF2207 domain-containing protein, partial [Chloroflexia bacterium]